MRMTRLAVVVAMAACAPLPDLIYPSQVRASFPEALREPATRCAERLNGHVRTARVSGTLRTSIVASGALLGGTGGVLIAVPGVDASVPLGLTLAGSLVGLVGELVVRLTGDPADLLTRHARGLRAWDSARRGGDAEELERCVRDEEPARPRATRPVAGEEPL